MNNVTLDPEEQDLLAAFEAGELASCLTPARKAVVEQSAAHTFKKDKRINIRFPHKT